MGLEALEGLWIGYTANLTKRTEDSARVGVNRWLTGAIQMTSIFNSIYTIEKALKAINPAFEKIPTAIQCVAYLTPVITNIVCSKFNINRHPTIKKTAVIINNHIGNVCVVAIAVSSVALIAFGQEIVGCTILAFLILGYAQRRCWLPLKLSQGIDFIGFVGNNVARIIIAEDLYYKFTAFVEVGNFAYLRVASLKQWFSKSTKKQSDRPITNPLEQKELIIDPLHLHRESVLPKAPDVDLKSLKTLFQKFDLYNEDQFYFIKEAILKDEHWNENHADKNSDEQIIKYITDGLDNFIKSVSTESIKNGEVWDYRSIKNRTKHIAQQLPNKSKEDQFTTLIQMALASYYCPAAYFEKIRSIYFTICDKFEEDSLASRIHQKLNESRKLLFESFLYFLKINLPENYPLDVEDNHFYNEFLNFLGDEFGLAEVEDAKQDALSYIDIFSKKLLLLLYRPLIKPYVSKYTKKYIMESLKEGLENGQIPDSLVSRWYMDEYLTILRKQEKPNPEELEKDYNQRLIEKATAWVQENVYDSLTGRIEPTYLYFLLEKMGVFKCQKIA